MNFVKLFYSRVGANIISKFPKVNYASQSGGMGSGSGKGGSGALPEFIGTYDKVEAAKEEELFYQKQREQLQKLKEGLLDEINFHEEQIRRHQEAIDRHRGRVDGFFSKKN